MFTLPGVLLFPSTSDVLHYSRDYSFSEQFNSSKLTQTCARAYLAKFRSRDIRRNARFNTQRNAFDSARARRQCEFVRICLHDFEANATTTNDAYETTVPVLPFPRLRTFSLFAPGITYSARNSISQCADSSCAPYTPCYSHFLAKSGGRSFPEQGNRNFRLWRWNRELSFFFYPAREMCFSKRQHKRFPDNIINFNLFNRTSVSANIFLS